MDTRILREMVETAQARRFQAEAEAEPQAHPANGGHQGQKMVFGVWRKVGELQPHEHDALADTYHAASGESARQAREHESQGMAAAHNPELAKFHRLQAEKHDKRAQLQMSASLHHERKAMGQHGDHPAFALRGHLSDHGDDGGVDLSHERSKPRGTYSGPVTTASGSAAFDPKNARSQPHVPTPPPKEKPSTAAGDHPAFRGAPRIPKHTYGGG